MIGVLFPSLTLLFLGGMAVHAYRDLPIEKRESALMMIGLCAFFTLIQLLIALLPAAESP